MPQIVMFHFNGELLFDQHPLIGWISDTVVSARPVRGRWCRRASRTPTGSGGAPHGASRRARRSFRSSRRLRRACAPPHRRCSTRRRQVPVARGAAAPGRRAGSATWPGAWPCARRAPASRPAFSPVVARADGSSLHLRCGNWTDLRWDICNRTMDAGKARQFVQRANEADTDRGLSRPLKYLSTPTSSSPTIPRSSDQD